jgi:segregation and condensation protein B
MDLKSILEALIFVSGKVLGTSEMMEILEGEPEGPKPSRQELQEALAALEKEWEERGGAIRLIRVAEGYEFRTLPEYAPWIRLLDRPRPHRLSTASAETLALIAYRQPVTRTEIEQVRGVDSGAVLKNLLEHRLIRTVGRKEEPGRPILYATSKEFLELFGLRDLDDLPPLAEFEEMVKAQGSEGKGEEADLSVADLISTPEEVASLADTDREALEELDESLRNLKDVEKTVNTATAAPPEVPSEEKPN